MTSAAKIRRIHGRHGNGIGPSKRGKPSRVLQMLRGAGEEQPALITKLGDNVADSLAWIRSVLGAGDAVTIVVVRNARPIHFCILQALASGEAFTFREIAKASGYPPNSYLRITVRDLVMSGRVERLPGGFYRRADATASRIESLLRTEPE